MATKTGSGFSRKENAVAAAREAVSQALKNITGGPPDLVVVFASTVYDLKALLKEIRVSSGASHVVGCTTAGEFTEQGPNSNSVEVMAVKSDGIVFEPVKVVGLKSNPAALTNAVKDFQSQCGDMSKKDYVHATVMMFIDPFLGDGEGMVNALRQQIGAFGQVVGGAAGDDGKFVGSNLFYGDEVLSEAVVLVKIFSRNRIGIGAKHGMNNCTKPMRVTKSAGAVLHEIDGKPAFDAYLAFAKTRGVDLTHESAPAFMMDHELAIQAGFFTKIRAPFKVNPDGSLQMAAEVPQGSMVCIVDSDAKRLTQAATEAAEEANKNLGGNKASGVLVFDCICRKTILGNKFGAEIDAIASVFEKNTPIVGFATYGEIAQYGGLFNGWHNSTSVVCAFPE
jgi:methyl-accepting chemotaxis protein